MRTLLLGRKSIHRIENTTKGGQTRPQLLDCCHQTSAWRASPERFVKSNKNRSFEAMGMTSKYSVECFGTHQSRSGWCAESRGRKRERQVEQMMQHVQEKYLQSKKQVLGPLRRLLLRALAAPAPGTWAGRGKEEPGSWRAVLPSPRSGCSWLRPSYQSVENELKGYVRLNGSVIPSSTGGLQRLLQVVLCRRHRKIDRAACERTCLMTSHFQPCGQ